MATSSPASATPATGSTAPSERDEDHADTGCQRGIQARLRRDPELCRLTLKSALEELLDGEVEVAKALLRDYVIARMGYVGLGTLTGKTSQSLARMLVEPATRRPATCSR